MKLSELVYRTVKNAIYLDDVSFTYDNFKKDFDTFNDSAEYGNYIQNAMLGINEAIARLNDLNRIPFRISEKLTVSDSEITLPEYITIENNNNNKQVRIKEVIGVARVSKYGIMPISFRQLSQNKLFVFVGTVNDIQVEFKIDIPHFSNNDFRYEEDVVDNTLTEIKDIELYTFGISDSMCNYIMEYVSAKLTEDVNASVSNLHINRAEQYFINIAPYRSAFAQSVVMPKYRI